MLLEIQLEPSVARQTLYHWTTPPAPSQWFASPFQSICLASWMSILVNLTSQHLHFPSHVFCFVFVLLFPSFSLAASGIKCVERGMGWGSSAAFYWIISQPATPQRSYTQYYTNICTSSLKYEHSSLHCFCPAFGKRNIKVSPGDCTSTLSTLVAASASGAGLPARDIQWLPGKSFQGLWQNVPSYTMAPPAWSCRVPLLCPPRPGAAPGIHPALQERRV